MYVLVGSSKYVDSYEVNPYPTLTHSLRSAFPSLSSSLSHLSTSHSRIRVCLIRKLFYCAVLLALHSSSFATSLALFRTLSRVVSLCRGQLFCHHRYCARYREEELPFCFSSQRGYRRCDINQAAFIGRDYHPLTHIVRWIRPFSKIVDFSQRREREGEGERGIISTVFRRAIRPAFSFSGKPGHPPGK